MSAFISAERYVDPASGRLSAYFSKLFILIGQDSLQYCILDTEKNTFVSLVDFRLSSLPKTPELFYAEISKLILEEESLKKKYPSVVLGLDTPLHTMVPASLYDPGQGNNYLELIYGIQGYGEVRADRLQEIDAFNVYSIPQALMDIITANYGDAAQFHRSTAMIRAIYNYQKINPEPAGIYLNMRSQFIDLASLEASRPVFFNSFSCTCKEDVLYYTLYAIEQLNLRPENVRLHMMGMIDHDSEPHQLLGRYINHLSFTSGLDLWNFSPLLSQVPAHRYLELYALALCGS